MPDIDNKNVTTSRDRLLGLASERYPDRHFQGQIGQDGQEGQDSLEDAIYEMISDYSTKQAAYDENNGKLRDLLMSDPESAEFMQKWIETGDPRKALVEQFGDELGMSEEARSQFGDNLSSWRTRKEENDRLASESQANWDKSLADLEEWGNAKGLSLEQKRDVMGRLLAITFNGMENKYGTDDFELAWKAINHDSDVDNAREEGMVAGKNAKIRSVKRDRAAAASLPPASVGGQGMRGREPKPAEPQSVWSGIE